MRSKKELKAQIEFLTTLVNTSASNWAVNMADSIRADVQDKLDGLNGVVASSLQSPKWSDDCVEDVQASGLPSEDDFKAQYLNSPPVQGLPTSDKQLLMPDWLFSSCISHEIKVVREGQNFRHTEIVCRQLAERTQLTMPLGHLRNCAEKYLSYLQRNKGNDELVVFRIRGLESFLSQWK